MLYELGIATTVTTTATPILEILTGGRPISILEMGFFNTAATAGSFQIGRPGNTPTGGTGQTATLPIQRTPGGVASAGQAIVSGWTLAPTISAAGNVHRKFALPGAIGNGAVYTWNPLEMVVESTRSSSIVLWTLSVVGLLNCYIKFLE